MKKSDKKRTEEKREYDRQHYLKNKEKRLEQSRQYRLEHKEEKAEYDKKYYQDNKERINKQNKKWYDDHRGEVAEYSHQYYQENKEWLSENNKQYRIEHVEETREYNKQYRETHKEEFVEYKKQWYEKNKERLREKGKQYRNEHRTEINEYWRVRRQSDPAVRLRHNVSTVIGAALKADNGSKKGQSVMKYLPYTMEELKAHIESQFNEFMTWENYGSYWHLDHIYPQCLLPYESLEHPNFQKCWALENLRPLEAIENLKKGKKVK